MMKLNVLLIALIASSLSFGQIDCAKVTGNYSGECVSFYRNGSLKKKADYVNGKLHGEYIEFYPNGEVKKYVKRVKVIFLMVLYISTKMDRRSHQEL